MYWREMGYLLDSGNHYILLYKNRKLAFKNLYVVSTGVKGISHWRDLEVWYNVNRTDV
jgi:hypothetical protein